MVVATLIITAIMILLFGELPSLVQSNYTVYVHFPDARGVTQDTPVRKSGILIGRVTEVAFADGGGVLVTCKIRDDVRLYRNEVCRASGSLLGDAELEFIKENGLPEGEVQDGDLLVGVVTADPLRVVGNLEGDLTEAIGSIARTSDQVGKLASQVNDLLQGNGEQFGRVVDKVEANLDSLQVTLNGVNDILGKPQLKANIEQSLADLPAAIADVRKIIADFQNTISLADRSLDNLASFTEPLRDRGGPLMDNIDSATRRMDDLLAELLQFSRALNSSEGSLNQFLNNPDLYQRLDRVMCNVEHLTRDLRPVVRDARVFSDKISRHPEKLGVRGAIERSTGVK